MVTTCMEIEISPAEDDYAAWLAIVVKLRDDMIGSNVIKDISKEKIPRLLQLIQDNNSTLELKYECAIVLNSFARGRLKLVELLNEKNTVQILMDCIQNNVDLKLHEACVRCLRTIACRTDCSKLFFKDYSYITSLVSMLNKTILCQQCVSVMFANICKTTEHQNMLLKCDAVQLICRMICNYKYYVQVSGLMCLATMTYQNLDVSQAVAAYHVSKDATAIDLLKLYARGDSTIEMQLLATKCLCYMYRSGLNFKEQRAFIVQKILNTLTSICQPDKLWPHRCEAAECLTHFIQLDPHLQRKSSYCGQILSVLSDFFNYNNNNFDDVIVRESNNHYTYYDPILNRVGHSDGWVSYSRSFQNKTRETLSFELKRAALLTYASLAANSEDVRNRILESSSVLNDIVSGLSDPNACVKSAALRCLVSLSRSIYQLRTKIHDKEVWKVVVEILQTSSDNVLLGDALALLCNLLLDFCPSKSLILKEDEDATTPVVIGSRNATTCGNVIGDAGSSASCGLPTAAPLGGKVAVGSDDDCGDDGGSSGGGVVGEKRSQRSKVISRLLELTRSENVNVRVNAIWAFMNLTYDSSHEVKRLILASMSNDDIFHLVVGGNGNNNNHVEVVAKALATIRNLLSSTGMVDEMMRGIGRQVMETVVLVLESDYETFVKEQALCILVNISVGDSSKSFIMDNSDVLRKIMNYLVHECESLQIAANDCIYNLITSEGVSGYLGRREIFSQMQLEKVLKDLQPPPDSVLYERLNLTYNELL